jgi:hypothetical protein
LKVVATALAIRCTCILGASARISRTCLCGIAGSGRSTTDSAAVGKLAVVAASLIAVIADCITREFAGRRVTARVACTSAFATAITVFALFNNAIAAFLSSDSLDVSVGSQTGGFDTIAAQSAANVANTAWTESPNTRTG